MTSRPAQPLIKRLPLLEGLRPLDRTRVPAEVLGGITLAALAIPEVMGYTSIAGMPVVTGLYTILLPIFAFALLGSSRHLVVGADSATAAVMAATLVSMAAVGSAKYIALAGLLAFMAAGLLIVARLVGLGFLADFLSRTVLVGFLSGVGIQVACGQVGGIFGVPTGKGITLAHHEYTGAIATLASTLGNLGQTSWTTVAVSASVIIVMFGLRRVNRRIPGALIAVIGSIVVSKSADLAAHGVATLGKLPGGLPRLGLPDVTLSDVGPLLGTAFSIFVLILAQSAATSRAYAAKYDDNFHENVDLIGLATANVFAGVSGAFVVNGSPTKTQMVDGAGGRSQLAQITTGLIVLVVLVFLTSPIQYMPRAVLSSVVLLIGIELVDVGGMRKILRLRPDEFVVATLVGFTVITIGVEAGIVLAIVASLIDHLRRSYRPPTAVLTPFPNRMGWHTIAADPDARSVPGFVIYRFAGTLYYANASYFVEQVEAFATSDEPLSCFCIEAAAMPDLDYSGGEAIRQLHANFQARRIRLVVADPMDQFRSMLSRYGLTELLGEGSVFDTVAEALSAFETTTHSKEQAPAAGQEDAGAQSGA